MKERKGKRKKEVGKERENVRGWVKKGEKGKKGERGESEREYAARVWQLSHERVCARRTDSQKRVRFLFTRSPCVRVSLASKPRPAPACAPDQTFPSAVAACHSSRLKMIIH